MRLEPEFIRNLMRERSPSTAYVTALLNSRERSGVRALFAFITICRDAVDRAGSRTEAQQSVALLLRLFSEGVVHRIATDYSVVNEVIDAVPDFGLAWEAWSYLEEDFEIPRTYAIEFVRGLKQDADGYRPKSLEDLLSYAYRTGGVLGLAACHIFSAGESVQQSAVDAASAARLSMLANNIYKDFTLGRCFVPLDWMGDAVTHTFASTWAGEATVRFQQTSSILASSSRPGLAGISFRNRAAISVCAIIQRESHSNLMRKTDRIADELIRQSATAIWSTLGPLLRRTKEQFRNLTVRIAEAIEQRNLKPVIEALVGDPNQVAPTDRVQLRTPRLPERDLATALRNQNILMGRDV